jgi:hypothetical protein
MTTIFATMFRATRQKQPNREIERGAERFRAIVHEGEATDWIDRSLGLVLTTFHVGVNTDAR